MSEGSELFPLIEGQSRTRNSLAKPVSPVAGSPKHEGLFLVLRAVPLT
jgi:hypothetical protein